MDHVSITTSAEALERLGFTVTATPGTGNHARVILHRAYLEVQLDNGANSAMAGKGWFLRPVDLDVSVASLRAHGLASSDPLAYVGRDGRWLDVQVDGNPDAALPILTRRTDVRSSDWPPPLHLPHANGALRLARIQVRTNSATLLRRLLRALGVQPIDAHAFVLADRSKS